MGRFIIRRKKHQRSGIRDEDGPIRCDAHLKWVRGLQCAVPDCDTGDRIEAAHVRSGTDGGTGQKPGDNWVVPLCATHHREQHQDGEATFWRRHIGIHDPRIMARDVWVLSPAGKRYRM